MARLEDLMSGARVTGVVAGQIPSDAEHLSCCGIARRSCRPSAPPLPFPTPPCVFRFVPCVSVQCGRLFERGGRGNGFGLTAFEVAGATMLRPGVGGACAL
jgi:hypothetical protein